MCVCQVQAEMDQVVGFERPPGLEDKPKLNYFVASIMETQRIASIVPLRSVDSHWSLCSIRSLDWLNKQGGGGG